MHAKRGKHGEIARLNEDLQKLATAFEKSPERDLAFTLKNMPEEVQMVLYKKAGLSKEQL